MIICFYLMLFILIKRLFLKLVKDLEDEEKSNQEKMSISAGSSPRSQDPGGVHGGDLDDLLFF